MSLRFRMHGVGVVTANLAINGERAQAAMARALTEEAETIIREAKDRVPVETGALRTSGFVEPPVVLAQRVGVTLGFGGPAAEYAAIVHEDLEAKHTVGGPKYLESVLLEHEQTFATRIADRVAQIMGLSR